jgi:transcriptional regulator with XRE-family HTH domain
MSSPLREQFGTLLRNERQSRGLTQAELAALAKLSRRYIVAIEHGEANVTIGAMERLACALDWSPFERQSPPQHSMPYGVKKMVLMALTHISQLAQTVIPWMESLDDAMLWPLANARVPRRTLSQGLVLLLARRRPRPARQLATSVRRL